MMHNVKCVYGSYNNSVIVEDFRRTASKVACWGNRTDFKESGSGQICLKDLKISKKNSQVTLFLDPGLIPQYPGKETVVLQRDGCHKPLWQDSGAFSRKFIFRVSFHILSTLGAYFALPQVFVNKKQSGKDPVFKHQDIKLTADEEEQLNILYVW
jgi:hypothetical protein